MCFLCSLWKYLSHSHIESCSLSRKHSWSMNGQLQVAHLSLASSVSHVEHVCLDGLSRFDIKSCECVFSWSPMHLSIIHTLIHFCWSLDDQTPLWQSENHPTIDSIDCTPKQYKNAKLVLSSCAAHKKFNKLPCWPPKQLNPVVTLGLNPFKNYIESTDQTRSTEWGNCTDKPDKHLVPVLVSFRKLCSFSSQSSGQSTGCSSKKLCSFHE